MKFLVILAIVALLACWVQTNEAGFMLLALGVALGTMLGLVQSSTRRR